MSSSEDKGFLDKIKDQAKGNVDSLKRRFGLSTGEPWPQTQSPSGDLTSEYPGYKTRGFLPPILISPTKQFQKSTEEEDDPEATPVPKDPVIKSFGKYIYTDWRGQMLKLAEELGSGSIGDTKDKFNNSNQLPKSEAELLNKPYSTRDSYLLFNDNSQDYFRHGIQVIDNINNIDGPEFWETQTNKETATKTRLSTFKGTSFENNDPVMFGFEIIIDDISSPLLNGSITDFLDLFGPNISEIEARRTVYEDFKNQFVKLFKTRATVRIDDSLTKISNMKGFSSANAENTTNLLSSGKKSYMNYYIKKIGGLEKLVENNTPSDKTSMVDYNKDIISITFGEDVSLSIGTLAHLYKLLYWSRANGKGMIPENLLRFNCDIIISEVRNFNRVRKSIETGDIEVIKDNVSRYVYSLKECQFYFSSMPHDSEIDLSSIKVYDTYVVNFDYKYSTTRFERFVPNGSGFGQYVGYDSGAMWKLGNIGQRETIKENGYGKSVPQFLTSGTNKYGQNGVSSPIIMSKPGKSKYNFDPMITEEQAFQSGDIERPDSGLENFKERAKQRRKKFKSNLQDKLIESVAREKKFAINQTVGLLNSALNKILNAQGVTGVSPPKNIYDGSQNALSRIFYDVRGEVMNFVGGSLGGLFGG